MSSRPAPTTDKLDSSPKGGPDRRRRRGRRTAIAAAVVAAAGLAVGAAAWSRRATDPNQIWAAGQAALKAGQIDEAEQAANRLAALNRGDPADWMLQAQVDIARGRTDQAIEKLARIPDEHKMAAQARLMAGQLELRRQRVRFAEAYYRQALALDPKLISAHSELIYIYGYQLRRAELDREFLALSRLKDLAFQNVFHWCLMRSAHWEPGPAIEDLSRFIEADPEDRWSRLAIAENYRLMGLSAEAEAAISPLPDSDLDALAIRVMLAIDRHQEEEAERMLASSPANYAPLARIRGRLALARRDAKAAVRNFRIAQADDPLNRDTVLGLANALTMMGDDSAAAPARETVRKLEVLNTMVQRAATPHEREKPELLRALGASCADLGQDAVAIAWYKIAIARDPLDKESQQALFRLTSRSEPDRGDSPRP
jgi:tetratricopeptide (TPR) repeat protein